VTVGILLPLVLVAPLTAAACLPLGHSRWSRRVSLAGAALLLALAVALAARVHASGPFGAPRGWLHADALTALLVLVQAVVTLASAWYATHYMAGEEPGHAAAGWTAGRFDAMFHLLAGSLVVAALADNLGLMWIALEASTLASALLVGYYDRPGAVEAGWKYLVLCSVGIMLALFGTVLLYYSASGLFAEHAEGLRWTALRDAAPRLAPRFVMLAFVFTLVGYGTKAGLAPMHTWLPDAHSQAPTPVSAMLSAAMLATALVAVLRVHVVAAACLGPEGPRGLLVGFGLLSVVVATPFLLLQGDYKRLLAYSSVEHTGFVALAVGLGTPLAVFGGLLHLCAHALAKTLAFLVGGSLARGFGSRRMDHWGGALAAAPPLGALFVVAGVALAGLPPSALFLSEWLTLLGGLAGGHAAAAVTAAVALVIVFAGLAYHWTRVALGRPREGAHDPLPAASHAPMWGLAVVLVVLGAWIPGPLRGLLEQAARVLAP
jgi:hydrogenase-4 component F